MADDPHFYPFDMYLKRGWILQFPYLIHLSVLLFSDSVFVMSGSEKCYIIGAYRKPFFEIAIRQSLPKNIVSRDDFFFFCGHFFYDILLMMVAAVLSRVAELVLKPVCFILFGEKPPFCPVLRFFDIAKVLNCISKTCIGGFSNFLVLFCI